MSAKRIVGAILVTIGMVSLLWGGVFWTQRETILDAGPIEVTTEEREGFALPQAVGVLSLVGGIVLLVVPDRRRAEPPAHGPAGGRGAPHLTTSRPTSRRR